MSEGDFIAIKADFIESRVSLLLPHCYMLRTLQTTRNEEIEDRYMKKRVSTPSLKDKIW